METITQEQAGLLGDGVTFVALWTYNGGAYSCTHRWWKGELQLYVGNPDTWEADDSGEDLSMYDTLEPTYYIAK